MRDKRMFVQFIHPGGEHSPDVGRSKRWNEKLHRRKFLVSPGALTDGGSVQDTNLVFWGEWEAESTVVREFSNGGIGQPRFLHAPSYRPRDSYLGLQNTDPFVFGGFHYTGCQQRTVRGPTQLRFLQMGSVILFGSCLKKSDFVLDTVFVVKEFVDHSKRNFDRTIGPRVSDTYREVTFGPWYENEDDEMRDWRLYFGGTFEDPVSGMYSFFPALPFSVTGGGFARPVIRLPGVITPHLIQGRKTTEVDMEEARNLWEEVVTQVLDQELLLGVRAEIPKPS